MKTVIIGSGNVATQLGKAFQASGFKILQVISRTKKNAEALAKQLKCKSATAIENIEWADLIVIAVSDNAIESVAKKLDKAAIFNETKKIKPLVIHTAGSVSLAAIKNKKWNSAVFYPLQTIKKNTTVSFKNVPLIYFAADKQTKKEVENVADKIGATKIWMTDKQRLALHTAAVFTNNFSNYMVKIAQQICTENKIDFNLLQPLLTETFEKLKNQAADETQTGPAFRGDEITIEKHLAFLKNSNYKPIYNQISKAILKENTKSDKL